ncbi:2-phospho-L-lactate guanylyltransferase [Nocardioides sp.]|uniref:2-phospho-L-lactate guanylyltransferase n=1 Tax=Nocardioides sp. TaxID=35761 RepID=UPI002B278B19|nr:2-phospho-L-lactate guanylyltransferase [Nocardioides sp.]
MQQYVVVMPVKPPAFGKSRLVGPDDGQRRDLAEAFALDTATACLAATRVAEVLVVTDDAHFAARLGALGCSCVPDGDSTGLNAALRQAVAEARRRWPALLPVAVLADLPALRPHDLDAALGSVVPGGPSYVVDAEGSGTTLYTASYDEFEPSFGPDSAHAHQVGGALAIRGDLTTLRHDVDDVDDLRAAVTLGLGVESARLAAALLD